VPHVRQLVGEDPDQLLERHQAQDPGREPDRGVVRASDGERVRDAPRHVVERRQALQAGAAREQLERAVELGSARGLERGRAAQPQQPLGREPRGEEQCAADGDQDPRHRQSAQEGVREQSDQAEHGAEQEQRVERVARAVSDDGIPIHARPRGLGR
jgi:hypothetical protein